MSNEEAATEGSTDPLDDLSFRGHFRTCRFLVWASQLGLLVGLWSVFSSMECLWELHWYALHHVMVPPF